jgi:hypothetical protein
MRTKFPRLKGASFFWCVPFYCEGSSQLCMRVSVALHMCSVNVQALLLRVQLKCRFEYIKLAAILNFQTHTCPPPPSPCCERRGLPRGPCRNGHYAAPTAPRAAPGVQLTTCFVGGSCVASRSCADMLTAAPVLPGGQANRTVAAAVLSSQ